MMTVIYFFVFPLTMLDPLTHNATHEKDEEPKVRAAGGKREAVCNAMAVPITTTIRKMSRGASRFSGGSRNSHLNDAARKGMDAEAKIVDMFKVATTSRNASLRL